MANFTLTGGLDNFTGSPGENNTFFLTPLTLQATDVVTGGATGAFIDILQVTAAGTIIASQFSGVTTIEEMLLATGGNTVTLTNGLVAGSSLSGNRFIVTGDAGQDIVDGSGITNGKVLALSGSGGDDVLLGGSGGDTLDGGPGNDTMAGGTGNDTYFVDSEADSIFENPGGGTDTVLSTVNYTLSANVDHLTLVEGAAGAINAAGNGDLNIIIGNSNNNALSGNGGDDVLLGGAGNDIIIGGIGNDAMAGGAGNDTYFVDSEADSVFENLNEGIDLVRASVNWTLRPNVENLIMLAGAVNGAGHSGANVITGNDGNNTISGNGGADVLNGNGGNDKIRIIDSAFTSINGGSGFDWLVLTANGQSLDLTANVSKITNIEVISLSSASAASLSLTAADIPLINASGNSLYVLGEADDTVTVGGTWTLVTNAATNANLPGIVFVQYHNAATNSDLFIADSMAPTISTVANTPPTIDVDGVLNYVENGAAAAVDPTITITDVDDTHLRCDRRDHRWVRERTGRVELRQHGQHHRQLLRQHAHAHRSRHAGGVRGRAGIGHLPQHQQRSVHRRTHRQLQGERRHRRQQRGHRDGQCRRPQRRADAGGNRQQPDVHRGRRGRRPLFHHQRLDGRGRPEPGPDRHHGR